MNEVCGMPALALSRVGARVVESGPGGGQELAAGTWQKLEALPDPRSPRGRVYPLACLVAIALCAFTAAGNDRLTAVGQWIRRASQQDLAAHVSGLDFPYARQAIKITRWRQDTSAGKASRQTGYAVTTLTSADATAVDLARLVREQWSIQAHHHIRDLTFTEDAAASRTGSGPVNLATIRAAVIAALKDAGYLHIPEGRRDHTIPAETLRLHGLG
jgi:predicted transposase YbfD/YdcC